MGSVGDALPIPGPFLNRPKVLFIDAYDSFSNNITSLLTTLLDVDVFVLSIDAAIPKADFRRELSHYEAVVCGPGPGSPDNESDVGVMRWLWELEGDDMVPVLGVCLGFQSLVLACGGKVRRLRRGLHGMVRKIEHRSIQDALLPDNLFKNVEEFQATLYHSLCVDVRQDNVADWEQKKWESPSGLPDVVPQAWVEEDREDGQGSERILMAVKHQRKPFWGLQYHPESVCTEEEGNKVIQNWFSLACRWNDENGRIITKDDKDMLAKNAVRPSLLQETSHDDYETPDEEDAWTRLTHSGNESLYYQSKVIELPANGVEVPDIVEILGLTDTEHVILDSANANQPPPPTGVDVRGRFSIVALDVSACLHFQHHTGDDFVTVIRAYNGSPLIRLPLRTGQTVWHVLAEVQESRRLSLGYEISPYAMADEDQVPFLGGFVGFVTYEQGLSDIGLTLPPHRGHKRPDVCLAWVTRSIVVDHQEGRLHVQDLEGDLKWLEAVDGRLRTALWQDECLSKRNGSAARNSPKIHPVIQKPDQAKYEAKVRLCQEYIAAGDSYELCLTDQTKITRTITSGGDGDQQTRSSKRRRTSTAVKLPSRQNTSWDLYRTLRTRNPAPFASFVRIGGATLISSSPERFLQYNRSGLCSMQPMKGTVKKSNEPGEGCATTLTEAEAILHVPKEEAENLMIVDLVRHDLHGICGPGRVTVPELLKVEEYQTVYQMITTVEGQLPQAEERSARSRYSGLDVLSASLPPGSMTGAPKKRSCEILQQIENGKERSLYSGVVGYMCVSGRGDWSVTIRSMFQWDDECRREDGGEGTDEKEVWHIGAGGAVTILSTPEGEREEMFVKLARPLSIFT
ncbi:Aminodeoxychorismate synthase [Cytospora mali]|uniref:aminodeoxychorismate synthase n=1 Tax=Cytospora mali TaxID=578113 RepID=A0A194ULY0_CYTMA|nr:Aminodeoxychorismate synthase [Valsa mali var. pyri (nom. inval.)]